ncbi:MAG: TonB-dependent receptor plug domain-containing protein, partial [Methylobacter sp.]
MKNSTLFIPPYFPKKPIANAVSAQVRYGGIIGVLPLCLATSVMAAENHQDQPAEQNAVVLEKVIVTGKFPSVKNLGASEMEADILDSKRAAVSDTAKLLEDTPGVSLYGAGGVSSLPVIHGLNDDRVKIDINGMTLTSACANHMNPPLSYIDRSNIGKITILSGVTPVSLGGDSIGGTISVQTPDPVFAEPGKDILLD